MCENKSTAFVLQFEGIINGYYASGQRTTKKLAAAKFYIGSHSARHAAHRLAKQMKGQIEKIIINKVEVQICNGD